MKGRIAIFLALTAVVGLAAARGQTPIASEKVADGLWAAPTPGGANVGWFLLGDAVVAVDAGANDDVGRSVVAEIQKTTGQKPRYLIITHAHRDHAGGVAAFTAAGAQVVSAEAAAPGILFLLDAASRGGAGAGKSAAAASGAVLMTISERTLLMSNAKRRAEVYFLGPGHTRGDLVILLPSDGVLFSGDLAVNGVLPYVHSDDVDPKGWERILARLAALKISKLVPGHGKIGPPEGIADTGVYIRRVNEIALALVVGNVPESQYELQLQAPENKIENVPVTSEHVANVKAVGQFTKASRAAAASTPAPPPTPTPGTR